MTVQTPAAQSTSTTKVVVATTVALTFITFWQAAAVVLNDLASTMFYIGGITEQAIGKPAPWMVLGVMLFSYAVRSVYMESCGMFVRGGVYIVVKRQHRTHRGQALRLLTGGGLCSHRPHQRRQRGPISGRLLNDMAETLHQTWRTIPIRLRSSSAWLSPSTSGTATSKAFLNPATKLCASCRLLRSWW